MNNQYLKIKHWVKVGIFIVMAFTILRLYESNRDLKYDLDNTLPTVHNVDTVYRDRPYIPLKPYKLTQSPKKVIFYQPPIIIPSIDRVIVKTDTVKIYLRDSSTVEYNSTFLTNYTNSSKLLGLELTDKKLSVDLLSTNGDTYSQKYNINTNKYHYRFDGNSLTYKKKPFLKRFDLVVSYQFRPLNNLHNLDLCIKYNTSKFNYVMGIDGFYYPKYKNTPGWDIFFKVEYNF